MEEEPHSPWPVASVLPPAKPQSAFLRTSGHDCTMISQRMLGWPTKDSTISNTEINADVTQNFLRNNVFEIFGQLGRPLLSPLQGWKFLGVYTLTEVTETLLGHTPGQHITPAPRCTAEGLVESAYPAVLLNTTSLVRAAPRWAKHSYSDKTLKLP